MIQGGYELLFTTEPGPAADAVITDIAYLEGPNPQVAQVVVEFIGPPGQNYQLQTSPDMSVGSWTSDPSVFSGTGAPQERPLAVGGLGRLFLRVIEAP